MATEIEILETVQTITVLDPDAGTSEVITIVLPGPQGPPGGRGPQGDPGVLLLGFDEPVPAGTPPNTLIFRRSAP